MANAWLEKPVNNNVEAIPVVTAIFFKTFLAIGERVPVKFKSECILKLHQIIMPKHYEDKICIFVQNVSFL